jgi:integrase
MKGSIRPRGAAWEIKYDLPRGADGARRSRTETVRGSKSAAQRRLRELLGAIDRGEHVDPSRTTVAQLVAERIQLWRASGKISAKTTERREELAECQIGRIGGIQLQRLGTSDVERWHVAMLEDGLSVTTVRHAHGLLAQCLEDAVKHSLVLRNVARLQRPPRAPRKPVEIIPSDEIAPMLAKLEGHPLKAAVITALYTGIRRSEMLALTWADVDFDARTLRIERALEETRTGIVVVPTKGRRPRTISLPTLSVDTLRDHRRKQLELRMALGMGRPDDDALVFPDHHFRHRSPRNFSTVWGRTVRRRGLPPVTWHALRHTHASMLIACHVDIATIAKRLGHSSPATTLSTYAHCFKRDDRSAADAIDALVV